MYLLIKEMPDFDVRDWRDDQPEASNTNVWHRLGSSISFQCNDGLVRGD
jgi:hypothetical protein